MSTNLHYGKRTTNLANKVLRKIAELVGTRHIIVREQVLICILRFVAISEEELEQVEQADPV